MANAGFDFLWIEMQHSPLTFQDVAAMIWACRGAPAIPFLRVPDATEGDIQKAVDIGALGINVPMVASAEKMEAAVRFAKYPPAGVRSQGGGQYGALWGRGYRATANDNILVIAMIEQPAGVAVAAEIAAVEGVGLDPDQRRCVLALDDAWRGARTVVVPFIDWPDAPPQTRLNAAEVARVLIADVGPLLEPGALERLPVEIEGVAAVVL